jgi:hypothetical protein
VDTLGHALYGATLFSRTGLAGGRAGGEATRRRFDWTVWAAAGFSVWPDLASIGVTFTRMILSGSAPSFHLIPAYVFALYDLTHSLIVAGLFLLLLRVVARPVAVPALAWPLHVLMDMFTHGDGRWQTPVLYPLSRWHFDGINWWEHPRFVLLYWGLLPLIWLAVHFWRRSAGGGKA